MTEEKKKRYFYTCIGYIGILFVLVTGLRFIVISDFLGNFLALLGILCFGSYIRYAESQLPFTAKEKRVFKGIYFGALLIVLIISAFIIFG